MDPTLPAPSLFRQNCRHEDGWTDHYGALQAAFAYSGQPMPARYVVQGLWQHGCLGPWEAVTPGALVFNAPGAQQRPAYVARQEEADFLIAHGYAQARAIGVPILYTPPSGLARTPRSLLVMPTHTLVGDEFPDRSAFARYADEVKAFAADFDHVTVCVHPSCQRNGLWIPEFQERGFDIVIGAQTNDAHALHRMRALFEQYETVTTNGWGSHVAYALAFGAKVSLAGTKPVYDRSHMLRDLTWAADVRALDLTLAEDCQRQQREFLREFMVPPAAAVANRALGEWLLGARHRINPEEMAALLQDLVRPVASAPALSAGRRPLLFAVPAPSPDGAAEELLRFLGWLGRESRQKFAVLIDENHPRRAQFAAVAPVHSPEELAGAPALQESFEAIYAGAASCGERLMEWGGTGLPVLTRVTEPGMSLTRLAARQMAASLSRSGHFLADSEAAAVRLQRVFRVPATQITVCATVHTEPQAMALWLGVYRMVEQRLVPAPAVKPSLADIYSGWLLEESPEPAYVRAQLARAAARRQARLQMQAGQRREGVQILVAAMGRDLATKDPLVILESLCEIGTDLVPLDARQADILFQKATQLARATPFKVESFRRTAWLDAEISSAA